MHRCIVCGTTQGEPAGQDQESWYRYAPLAQTRHTAGTFCSPDCCKTWMLWPMEQQLTCIFGNLALAYHLINLERHVRQRDPESRRGVYLVQTVETIPENVICKMSPPGHRVCPDCAYITISLIPIKERTGL